MRAPVSDVTLTFPCDARFVETMRAAVWMAATSVGCSEARAHAAANAVAAFVEPELAEPRARQLVVEVVGTRARLSAGPRQQTVDF